MPDDDLTQISVGQFRVGISGLQQAIAEVKNPAPGSCRLTMKIEERHV